nr:lipoprotein [uncultured Halomonas sp.]
MLRLSSIGIIALFLTSMLLVGCGQKGPLYLPGDEEAAEAYDPGDEYTEPGPEQDERESDAFPDSKEER